jgi:hypothetical protein
MRHRLLIAARSILLGWVALLAATYLVERPLLRWTAPLLGASWFPTAQLALECAALAATGWVMGRWNRSGAIPAVLVFAAMIAVWNFSLVPAINIPWLFRLMRDTIGDARYLESLITTAVTHALLFGSLIIGARLSRPRQTTMSVLSSHRSI